MKKAFIHFSYGETIELKEGDFLTPAIIKSVNGKIRISVGNPIMIWDKLCNREYFHLMDCFYHFNFFYLNRDYDVGYNSRLIEKIEML